MFEIKTNELEKAKGHFIKVLLKFGVEIAEVEDVITNEAGVNFIRYKFLGGKHDGEVRTNRFAGNNIVVYERGEEAIALLDGDD